MCNSDHVRQNSATKGYDQALIVRDVPEYGGSGGSIPVISAGPTPRMMLHEYLHTLGLCDEYEYSASEAQRYCNGTGQPNLVAFNPVDEGYDDDASARSQHGNQIPWFSDILATTLITNGRNLGTGAVSSTPSPVNTGNTPTTVSSGFGLYQGKTCNNKTPAVKTWHPGGEKTIMHSLSYGLGAVNEKIVREILIAKGAAPKSTGLGNSSSSEVNNNGRAKIKDISKTSDDSKVKSSGAASK